MNLTPSSPLSMNGEGGAGPHPPPLPATGSGQAPEAAGEESSGGSPSLLTVSSRLGGKETRFAYLALPALQLEVALQRRPVLAGQPVALWESRGNRVVLVACSPEARAAGVRPGMTRPEGRALCHALETLPVEPPAEGAALAALAGEALALSPWVSPDAPDGLYVEAASCAHLWGGEPALLAALRALAARRGFSSRAAVADGARLARLAALHGRDPLCVLPAGRAAVALADLPLDALALDDGLARRLRLLGLATLGDLARLPPSTLPRRFGPAGVALARLARGDDAFVPPAFVPGGLVTEALELEAPLDTLEPLLFALKRLLDRVELRLRARGAATTRLEVALGLDDGATRPVEVALAHPFRAAGSLLRIARARLQQVELAAPVVRLAVTVLDEAPYREASADLFRRGGSHEEGVAELVARLVASLGAEAVFAVRPRDVYRPEEAWEKIPYSLSPGLIPPHLDPPPRGGRGEPSGDLVTERGAGPERPLLLLDPPEPAAWTGDRLRWRTREWCVDAFTGPERLQGEWWKAEALDRDYYTLTLDDGGRLWVYEDPGGEFFVHGVFE